MAKGTIRAWDDEARERRAGRLSFGKDRSAFRRAFTTELRAEANEAADTLATLAWGDEVELPDGIGDSEWTRAEAGGRAGFLLRAHVVELAWVREGDGTDRYVVKLDLGRAGQRELLWGDPVQVLRRQGETCRVRSRGMYGDLPASRLQPEPLLEVYFVDVGQGDGVLVRFPSGRHMLIDGGLPRANQMTGKNVVDFVDWKFHVDYGHHSIVLDGVVASHCDADHFGGLWDLVRSDAEGDRELDCVGLSIGTFFHAGLSQWHDRAGADPRHRDDLGPNDGKFFVRLLGDRTDAEAAVEGTTDERLKGWWGDFVEDLLQRNPEASVERLGVRREDLAGSAELPAVWPDEEGVDIRVLAPVTADRGGRPALKDLGDRGKNTNGHSVCLRLDAGDARILLTGDLNKKSMDWLMETYGDDGMKGWACDVVKACHHGSADISYRFLEKLNAAATIISSGDAEGHAHPRPEVVAASAVTGRREIDTKKDVLVTPLVYMTEIERSVALGEVSHVGFAKHPLSGGAFLDSVLFARPSDEIADGSLLSPEQREEIAAVPDEDQRKELDKHLKKQARERLVDLDEGQRKAETSARYYYRTVRSLFSIEYGDRSLWRSRIMTRNHYGLVNVRTDGKTVVCATMEEDETGNWTVHSFGARAGAGG